MQALGLFHQGGLVFQFVCCLHRYWAYSSKSTVWPKMESCFQNGTCSVCFLLHHHFMANRWGNSGNSERLYLGAPKSLQMVTAAMKLKDLALWKKSYDQSRQHINKQRHYFANKGPSSQSYGFFSSHVWM